MLGVVDGYVRIVWCRPTEPAGSYRLCSARDSAKSAACLQPTSQLLARRTRERADAIDPGQCADRRKNMRRSAAPTAIASASRSLVEPGLIGRQTAAELRADHIEQDRLLDDLLGKHLFRQTGTKTARSSVLEPTRWFQRRAFHTDERTAAQPPQQKASEDGKNPA